MAIAPWQAPADKAASAWVGFRLAARGRFGDYRDDAVYGKGIEAGLRADGCLFIGDSSGAGVGDAATSVACGSSWLNRAAAGSFASARTMPRAGSARGRCWTWRTRANCEAQSASSATTRRAGSASGTPTGPKFDTHGERAFGPILFTQYTLSRRVLKLTAQMAPVGPAESQEVTLSVRAGGTGAWRDAGRRQSTRSRAPPPSA